MKKIRYIPLLVAASMVFGFAPPAGAQQDEWKFGIGTGLQSFGLSGDLGFATMGGGVVFDVDLDNSDTSDLVESGFGFGGFFARGKWQILYSLGTVSLEDSDGGLSAEWDKSQVEMAGVYQFAQTGKHGWGALFGFRYIDHDWDFVTPVTTVDVDESWTDAIVGITHRVPISKKWSWSNRADAGFGESEGSFLVKTSFNWQATPHWVFNFNASLHSIEFGEASDIGNSDFYLYDIDETGVGAGFLYVW